LNRFSDLLQSKNWTRSSIVTAVTWWWTWWRSCQQSKYWWKLMLNVLEN